ncbi:MAG: hypothetical protein OIN87_00865 [Candidatus Methanoperedens sp.]|nr:hypothetical protein [Candidatus Methanoperedens sp.]
MIAACAGINNINTKIVRTQNELMLPLATNPTNSNELKSPEFGRKERKDSLIGLYAINHRAHREKWQSISIPVMAYERVATSRFRTRMTRIARIFADIVDRCASPFHSQDNKPQRSQRTQSRMEKLWVILLDDGLTLFKSWLTRIYTYLRVSASSVFYFIPSAFICVHPRLISVSLSDRSQKIKGDV